MIIPVDELVGYSGPLADSILLSVLIVRGRWKSFPAFSLLIVFDLVATVLNVAAGLTSNMVVYGVLDATSIFLQVAVVFELLRHVLPRTSKLATEGRRVFINVSCAGLLCAGVASFLYNPPRMHGSPLYQMKLDLFASLLVCETVVAIMLAAQKVGLGWRNHLIAIAQGLTVWAFLLVIVEGIGPYLSFHNIVYDSLYYVRSIAYLGTLGYWSVALWREEPARKPISPALRKYIVALHDQVNYDLGKTGY
jgi:hypothetical protein